MVKLSLISLTIALAAVLPVIAAPAPTFTLVDDGKPTATIVLAKNADKAARFGAAELNHYIKLITGSELPLVTDEQTVEGRRILVGESEYTRALGLKSSDFGSQAYMIKMVNPSTLVLMGKDASDKGLLVYDYLSNPHAVNTWPSVYSEIGTLNAVDDFLRDDCGVRWLNPTDVGTIVQARKTLTVSIPDVRRAPFMRYRGASVAESNSERYNAGGGHWRAGTAEANAFSVLGYSNVYASTTNPSQRNMGIRSQNRLFMYRMKAGGENSPCNHSFYNFYERFWNKNAKNFEAYHPEYFAQGYEGKEPPQLCYSNEAMIQQVIKDAQDYFDNGGHRKRWGENSYALEPMDNSAFCKGDACTSQFELDRPRQEQHSTYWFRFVNRIAAALKESHPDKKISTLAYMTHEGLPTGFKLEDNVVVHFCLSHNRTPYNRDALQKQFDRMNEWDTKENIPMYLWLYNTFPVEIANNGRFNCFPGFFSHEVKRQFDIFKKLEIQGIFHCGYNGEVENYVTYRLMDNPDLDIDVLLDQYFEQYGPAAKPIKAMYDLIEQRYCDPANYVLKPGDKPYSGHQRVDIAWGLLGTAEVMAKLQSYMDKAIELAVTDEQKTRVELWNAAIWSYMRRGRDEFGERMEAPMPAITAPRVSDAGGDPNKVAWDKASPLGSKWYTRGGGDPAALPLSGRVCHDGSYIYLELVDESAPEKLHVSPQIACFDDWELIISRQRAQPFRQYMIGPTGLTQGLSYGEVNWRQGVKATEYTAPAFGMKIVSDISGDRWISRMAFPMAEITDKPIVSGDSFYMNIMRVSNPALAKQPRYGIGIDTWVSYTTVKQVDRLGEIKLAP